MRAEDASSRRRREAKLPSSQVARELRQRSERGKIADDRRRNRD